VIALIDIGNTRTKAALYSDGWIREDLFCEEKEWISLEEKYLEASLVVISSVVPFKNTLFSKLKRAQIYHELNAKSPWGFQIGIENPETVGTDRLVNMEAVADRSGAVIVVDAGTATKFDLLEGVGKKTFPGGAIAPGMKISYEALLSRGAQLSAVDLEKHSPVVGYNTETAIRSGVLHGFASKVDGMIMRIFEERGLPAGTQVIATGGNSIYLKGRAKLVSEFRPRLTLEGMLAIAKKL
jgi:pantothenate kinase type III